MFNRLLTEDDIPVFAEIIEREKYPEKGFRYKELWNVPAGFSKWVSVLEQFKSLNKTNLKVVELGPGTGVVPYIATFSFEKT